MLQRDYPDQTCSIARSLEVVGERWTLLILRDAVLGIERFEEFQDSLTQIFGLLYREPVVCIFYAKDRFNDRSLGVARVVLGKT